MAPRRPPGQRSLDVPPCSLTAIDAPPPVWQVSAAHFDASQAPLPVSHRTTQHWATLTTDKVESATSERAWSVGSLAPPVLVAQRYFVWGLEGAKIGLWALSRPHICQGHRPPPHLSPTCVLEVSDIVPSPWVQLSAVKMASQRRSSSQLSECGTSPLIVSSLVGLTSAGAVCHVNIVETVIASTRTESSAAMAAPGMDDRSSNTLETPVLPRASDGTTTVQLELVDIWHTQRVGTSCLGWTSNVCLVGYLNGIIEGYDCTTGHSTPTTKVPRQQNQHKRKLLWSGHFPGYPRPTSIVPLYTTSRILASLNGADTETKSSQEENVEKSYLVYMLLTLEPRQQEENAKSIPTSDMVEVICLDTIPERSKVVSSSLCETDIPHQDSLGHYGDTHVNIALEDYWVLPDTDRYSGIVDTARWSAGNQHHSGGTKENESPTARATIAKPPRRRVDHHWIPSHGTHVATVWPEFDDHTDATLARSVHPSAMAELADGSILFLEAHPSIDRDTDDCEKASLHWGIRPCHGQFLLPFPTIGRGIVTLSDGRNYAACALRGGTVYFFPLGQIAAGENAEIHCCHYPDEISRTGPPFHRLQAFVAGNVQVRPGSSGSMTTPLLFYCWPGGLVDVYSATLLPSMAHNEQELTGWVEDGLASSLFLLLTALSTNDPDNLHSDLLWGEAMDQVQAWCQSTSTTSLSSSDLTSPQMSAVVQLLRRFATPSVATG